MTLNFSEDIKKEVFELTLALYRVTDFFPKNEVLRRSLREKANEIFSLITEYGYGAGKGEDPIQIFARIEAIKGYLDIARALGIVRPINISVLYREYEFLGEFFKKESHISDIRNDLKLSKDEMSVKDPQYTEKTPDVSSHKSAQDGVRFSVSESATFREHSSEAAKNPSGVQTKTPPQGDKQKRTIGHATSSSGLTERQQTIIVHLRKGERKARLGDLHAIFGNVSSKTIQRDLQDLVSRNVLRREGNKRWTTYFLVV